DAYKVETLLSGRHTASSAYSAAVTQGGAHIAVAIGRTIHVASATGSCIVAVVRHEHRVTCAALSSGGGQFVAFGDALGALYIVHVATRRVVFGRALGLGGVRRVVFGRELGDALVVAAGAHVVRFAGIRVDALGRAVARGDDAEAGRLAAMIGVAAAEPADMPHDGVADVAAGVLVAGGGRASLSRWQAEGKGGALRLADAVAGGAYVRVEASADGRYAVALDDAGHVDVYERRTLTRVFRLAAGASDFSLLPRRTGLRLAVVARLDDSASELRVVDVPAGLTLCAVRVARDTRLARGAGDCAVFVEVRRRAFSVRRLAGARADERLAQLVKRGRVAEAQAFARAQGFAPAHVACVRLAHMATLRTPLGEHEEEEALGLVREAQEAPQVVRLALALHVRTLRGAQTLVQLAQAAARASGHQALQRLADDAARRLGTWRSISGAFDGAAWLAFGAADVAAHVRALLAQGDVARAAGVWRRHMVDARVRDDVAGALHAFP
ncbi:hypothetical protein GGI05_006417, partial [Coemansia sp. RSA 2603]